MCKITVLIFLLSCVANLKLACTEMPKITTKNFQVNFLKDIYTYVDTAAQQYLNELLQELQQSVKNDAHASELQAAKNNAKLEQKIIFVKQFLDLKNPEHDNLKNFYALRNVNFLKKIEQQLSELQDLSAREIRQMRVYHLCKQFRDYDEELKNATHAEERTYRPPYSRATKLVAINDEHAADVLPPKTKSLSIDVIAFGRNLYENVNISGSEIIDDYLSAISRLLNEVISDRPEHEHDSAKLTKVLHEIDVIIGIPDFYEKRQRLYAYLQDNMAEDVEQFKSSQHAQEDLAEIFTKLKEKGLDLFVTFLFSNFEFLERLHEEWAKLLPQPVPNVPFDQNAKQLYDIHALYKAFKRDSENTVKYEAYMAQVKSLHERTQDSGESTHIFELLYNGSQNVGSITFNMIRDRCDNN